MMTTRAALASVLKIVLRTSYMVIPMSLAKRRAANVGNSNLWSMVKVTMLGG